jgi:hypothetical protein
VGLYVTNVDVAGSEVAGPEPDVAKHLFVQGSDKIHPQNIIQLGAAATVRPRKAFRNIRFFRLIEILTTGNP